MTQQYPPQQPAYWPQNQTWPGQGASQQQQTPQQQMPQQGHPQQQQQQQQQQMPQQTQAPGYPQQQPAAPPPQYQVDDAAIQQAYQQSQQQSGDFDKTPYFKWLGPNGEKKWNAVYVGYQRTVTMWICQPPQGSNKIFLSMPRHHIIWYEAGQEKHDNVDCVGADRCGVCQSALLAAQDPQFEKSVERSKARMQHYYQVCDLENPAIHFSQDGKMRPLILAAGAKLHNAIGQAVEALGGSLTRLVDPYTGRPLLLWRKKTGNETRDVEYGGSVTPDQTPMPQQFWGVLHNLWKLEDIRKKPTQEDYTQTAVRLGWPVAGQSVQAQVPANFNPGPQPPHLNPYPGMPQQQQMPPQGPPPQMQGPPPGQYQAPPQQPPGAFQPPPMAPPPQSAMPGVVAQGFGPGAETPPPPQQQQLPDQPPPMTSPAGPPGPPEPTGGAPQPGGPPPLNPPPLTTSGGDDASQYAPQGEPQKSPEYGPPPMDDNVPFSQASGPQPVQQLTLDPQTGKLPQGTALPDGREMCFGKHAPEDMMCKECPEGIKSQCIPQTPGAVVAAPDASLTQLQQELEGQAPQAS